MSWETALIAYLTFKDRISFDEQRKIVKNFEKVFECEARLDDHGNWRFKDVNLFSDVRGKKIAELFKRYEELIKHFDFSLWYLSESPHEELYFSKGKILASQIEDF